MPITKTVNLLPGTFQSETNQKFLNATLDQLVTESNLKTISGYVGRKFAPGFESITNYIREPDLTRATYQLEPSVAVTDPATQDIEFHVTYPEVLQQISYFGGNVTNQSRLWDSEYYSYDPHINLDAFINFTHYYWVPEGPDSVFVSAGNIYTNSEITVFPIDSQGVYNFSNWNQIANPDLVLAKGYAYNFHVNQPGKPFWIQNVIGEFGTHPNIAGVTSNGTDVGTITFVVPTDITQDTYFYQDGVVTSEQGTIRIIDPAVNTINVDTDILGQTRYISPNAVEFVNGLKVRFDNTVIPETYQNKEYYVEGVGTGIKLVDVQTLLNAETGTLGSTVKDYITINRASSDVNPWSTNNRWFHQDVITGSNVPTVPLTADETVYPYPLAANLTADTDFITADQTERSSPQLNGLARANRPIIEFEADLKLYNFGTTGITPVNLLDTTITEPFLTLEGSKVKSVNGIVTTTIDGVPLTNGMTVIFAAMQNPKTPETVWKINFVDEIGIANTDVKTIHLSSVIAAAENTSVTVTSGLKNSGSYYYNGVNWIRAQQKTSVNQPPMFDVFDVNGISFGDTAVYPGSNSSAFFGTKIFSYGVGTGVADKELGFPLVYKNINNIGDIEFVNNFDNDAFVYTVDKVNYTDKVNRGYLYKNEGSSSFEKLNVWRTVVEHSKQYQDISYIFDGITNSFAIDVPPATDAIIPSLLVFVNYQKLTVARYTVTAGPNNTQIVVIDSTILKDSDRIDILVYSTQVSQFGTYEVPGNLNFNAQNAVLTTPTLGDMRNHINKLTQNSTKFLGRYPGVSNLRNIDVVGQGGTILQQSGPVTLAAMFLTDDKLNFVNSIKTAQFEYARFKNKFITFAGNSNQLVFNTAAESVDYILKQINKAKNKTFPWYYSDMVPYGDNKTITTHKVIEAAIRNYEISSIFSPTTLSSRAILVYHNGSQLLLNRDYTFMTNSAGVSLSSSVTLAIGDLIEVVEYLSTDGNYIPETPSKLGLYPKYKPGIVTDTTYLTTQQFIQGHDGSLTPVFNDFRDSLLLELEKRIYNNIKAVYDESIVNVYSVKPGKFRTNTYSPKDFNLILSRGYLPWANSNQLDYTTNSTTDLSNPFTFNYGGSIDTVNGETLPGSWRACYEYFYDTQHPDSAPWEMLGFTEKPSWWNTQYGPAPYTSGNKILWDDLEAGYIAQGPRQGIDPVFSRPGLSAIIPVDDSGNRIPPLGLLTNDTITDHFIQNWQVGQYSPVETAWRNSSEYAYDVQIALALTSPAKYFGLGVAVHKCRYNYDLGQFLLDTTNFRLTPADIDINGYTDLSGNVTRAAGYLNWIADYQTHLGILSTATLQRYAQNYTVQLSYRMAGFSGKQFLKILAEQNSPNSISDSVIIPEEDYSLVLNKSTPIGNPRYSAVSVEKTSGGFKVTGYDTFNPYFTVVIPNTTGNSYEISVLKESAAYYTEFTNYKVAVPYGTTFSTVQQLVGFLSGYEQFLTLQGFRFNYFDTDLEQIRNWALSVNELLFWVQQNWAVGSLIVLSPFADRVEFGRADGVVDKISNSFYGNKIMNQNFITLDPDSYKVVRDDNLFVLTTNSKSADMIAFLDLSVVQYEHAIILNNKTQFNDLIYDPALGQRQFRLKLVGSKTNGWTGILNPQGFVYNNDVVQLWAAGNDYLKGDLVQYKNFYYTASKDIPATSTFTFADWLPYDKNRMNTGLMNNFATNASMGRHFYDTDHVNLQSDFAQYALGLIGYRNRSYLTELGLDDTTQVKFYQGFIKEKGTHNAINALADVSFNSQESNSIAVNEEWAFRLGSYGSLETNQYVEIVLDENYTLNNPTSLQVVDDATVVYANLYTSGSGVHKTSATDKVWTSPFFLTRTTDSDYTNDIQTAGFVNLDDVDYTIFDLTDTSTLSGKVEEIGAGNIIWCAVDYTKDWNVYRVSESTTNVVKITNALNGRVLMKTDGYHGLKENDTVLVSNSSQFDGFYKIERVESLTSFVVKYNGDLTGFSGTTESDGLHKLVSLRFNEPSDVVSYTPVNGWTANSKVWINDNTANNNWAVYNKTDPWQPILSFTTESPYAGSNFGTSVKLSADNKLAIVGAPGYANGTGALVEYLYAYSSTTGKLAENSTIIGSAQNTAGMGTSLALGSNHIITGAPGSANGSGYVYVYTKNFLGVITQQQILGPTTTSSSEFGTSVAISEDAHWMYVGAPGEKAVYAYQWFSNLTSSSQTFSATTGSDTQYIITDFTIAGPEFLTATVITSLESYTLVYGTGFTVLGTTLTFVNPVPAGTLIVRQQSGYQLKDKIFYNNGDNNFGYSIATTTDGRQIAVGAPTDNGEAGSVSIYDRTVEQFLGNGIETKFSSPRELVYTDRVYVNDILQTYGTDYTIYSVSGYPTHHSEFEFAVAPPQNSIITIETNQFKLLKRFSNPAGTKAQLGFSVDIDATDSTVYAGAPHANTNRYYAGQVYRYVNQARVYGTITGKVQNPTVTPGNSIRINDFEIIFIYSDLDSTVTAINNHFIPGLSAANVNGYLQLTTTATADSNKIRILPGMGNSIQDLGLDVFVQVEIINNPTNNAYDLFGQNVKINQSNNVLAVSSTAAITSEVTVFDTDHIATTFDSGSMVFVDEVISGGVWMFSYLANSKNDIADPGVFAFVQQINPYSSGINPSLQPYVNFGSAIDFNSTEMIIGSNFDNTYGTAAGRIYQFSNPAGLLGWDVYTAEEPEVDINSIVKAFVYSDKSQTITHTLDYIDPAKGKILGIAEQDISYKVAHDPGVYNYGTNGTVTLDSAFHWDSNEVGKVWWDLSTVRFLNYEQGSIQYRTTNWGGTFPGSSIDVYEWVESMYPPSQYVATGGDGTPKYPDNSAYSTVNYVDPETNQTIVKYYYWVKDKSTVDVKLKNRTAPVSAIASYIKDPKNSGVEYFAAIRNDSVAIYNLAGTATGKDTILHIDYSTRTDADNIIHSEFVLLSETNSRAADIPTAIYNKLVDSVSGIDAFGNQVPDPLLPVQTRYGIGIRPRQSMFIDKNQAVHEMVDYINSILIKNTISKGFNLTNLSAGEPIPNVGLGLYNTTVPNLETLGYVDIAIYPVGYTVLVENDSSANNHWTIYTKQRNNTWQLTRTQTYNTADYWEFVDWYATGFDSSTKPTYTIGQPADLSTLSLVTGDIVKILNNGQGQWSLIQVFPNVVLPIGLQNGTIQLTSNLYDLEGNGMGFDNDNFDTRGFDQNPSIEIRNIFTALRDDIFINTMDSDFVSMFFSLIYYALKEQKSVDWVFKTSFVNVLHTIRNLNQTPIYRNENQDYYQQYIEEVKPYHTTIREYTLDYTAIDNVMGYVTDYDLPAYYDTVFQKYRSPSGEFGQDINQLQNNLTYQDWITSYTYSIGSIEVIDGGKDYSTPPIITITGSAIGDDATAIPIMHNGSIVSIVVTYPGSHYTTQPQIGINNSIFGGGGFGTSGSGPGVTEARLLAHLVNNSTRKLKATLVYDRINYGSAPLTGTRLTADNVNVKAGNKTITADATQLVTPGVRALTITADNYNTVALPLDTTLSEFDLTTDVGFFADSASLTTDQNYIIEKITAPANDRIRAFYQPTLGMPGLDYSLLQSGIDYPGVIVEGPLYTDNGGFGQGGFDISSFDGLILNPDGTVSISDSLLDAVIESTYTDSSLGYRPDDVIVDGGGYVDTYSSHAPEELIPGRVYDTLDMRISTIASDGAGIATSFVITSIIINDPGLGYGNVKVLLENTYTANLTADDTRILFPFGGNTITSDETDLSSDEISTTTVITNNATATFDGNGSIISITPDDPTVIYHTAPTVVILGANTSPANATVVMTAASFVTFDYRIFKSMNDEYQYLRIPKTNSTANLTADLGLLDTVIHVDDVARLPIPSVGSQGLRPGVVFINGERITYWTVDNSTNTLSNIRRATAGTGANVHLAGSRMIDGSVFQVVPQSAHTSYTPVANNTVTTTAGTTYTLSEGHTYQQSKLWLNTNYGITPTDGTGLFDSTQIQAEFIKDN